ncbi:MAG: hypothetical protein ACYTGB_10375, partial [Planctomycetota bacterium]
MPGDYSFEKRSPACSACGREFAVGEEYHSALVPVQLESAAEPETDAVPAEPPPDAAEGAAEPGGKAADAETPAPAAAAAAAEAGLPFGRTDLCAECWD